MKYIELTEELKRFHIHLQNNPRTILTASFGNGKTTFLNQYTKMYEEECEFITLHPVNYSCSSNEDVFEYIKRDILFQLAEKDLFVDVDFRAIDETLLSWSNIKELISFALSISPAGAVGKKLFDTLTPILEKGMHLKEEYDKKKVTWEKYKNLFENQKGGLYEHDLYTELIEKTLAFIHERNKKSHTTLIIEDMDRIDPAHLFRILNVLGAHLDNDSESDNKFGFKNIVLVLDYQTTAHIFHHFYGEHADYDGYMSKFISHNVFDFDIVKAAQTELMKTLINGCLIDEETVRSIRIHSGIYPESVTLGSVINKLNVREIAHILDDLDSQISTETLTANGYSIANIAPITILLSVLVRLNKSINYDELFRAILLEPWGLKLMQQYLLFSNIFALSRPFLLNRKGLVITPTKGENGYYQIAINRPFDSFDDSIDVGSELQKCFDIAKANVIDCH